jgi:hypothetical protein
MKTIFFLIFLTFILNSKCSVPHTNLEESASNIKDKLRNAYHKLVDLNHPPSEKDHKLVDSPGTGHAELAKYDAVTDKQHPETGYNSYNPSSSPVYYKDIRPAEELHHNKYESGYDYATPTPSPYYPPVNPADEEEQQEKPFDFYSFYMSVPVLLLLFIFSMGLGALLWNKCAPKTLKTKSKNKMVFKKYTNPQDSEIIQEGKNQIEFIEHTINDR